MEFDDNPPGGFWVGLSPETALRQYRTKNATPCSGKGMTELPNLAGASQKQTFEHDENSWPASFIRDFVGLRYDCSLGSHAFAVLDALVVVVASSDAWIAPVTKP